MTKEQRRENEADIDIMLDRINTRTCLCTTPAGKMPVIREMLPELEHCLESMTAKNIALLLMAYAKWAIYDL